MATSYPGSVDALPRPTSSTAMNATGYEGDTVIDNISDAVEAIETELGTDPSGTVFSTVKSRLEALEATAAASPWCPWLVASQYNPLGGGYFGNTLLWWDSEEIPIFFVPHRSVTLDRLACYVTEAGSTGAVVRLGLRAHDDTNGRPGSLIVDGGTVSTTTTGLKTVTISTAVTAGTPYWATIAHQGAAATKTTLAAYQSWGQRPSQGFLSDPAGVSVQYMYKAGVSAALNDTGAFTGWGASNFLPNIWIRTSA